MGLRVDGRDPNELRPVKITRGFMKYAEGSALMEMGDTKIICTASVEDRVPHFLSGRNSGWLTAEYAMLPRSTQTRTQRETRGVKGRSQEIQRLIGRALRAAVDLKKLGERHPLGGLRRAAGRRRHANRIDHRGLHRRRRRDRLPDAGGANRGEPDPGLRRRRQCRHHRQRPRRRSML